MSTAPEGLGPRSGRSSEPVPEPFTGIPEAGPFVLRLYVTGLTVRSERAIAAIKEVCQLHLSGRYDLKIVDVSKEPEVASREQIVAAPTLVKRSPLPLRRLVGDMSNRLKVLTGLGIRPHDGA